MKFDSRLIERPNAQPRLQRTAWGVVTMVFWGAYFYLWAPVITLVMWLLGVRASVIELYLREHKVDPFLLVVLPLMALSTAVLLIGWAEFNRYRYAGKERRQPLDDVGIEQVAAALGATMALAESLGRAKIAVLQMDAAARPLAITDIALPTGLPVGLPGIDARPRHALDLATTSD